MEYNILAIFVKESIKIGDRLQEIFSQYGCIIRTRLGLNNDEKGNIIIIDLHGDMIQIDLLLKKLDEIHEIEYKYVKL